jgi:hypothetical protein
MNGTAREKEVIGCRKAFVRSKEPTCYLWIVSPLWASVSSPIKYKFNSYLMRLFRGHMTLVFSSC